MRQQQQRLSDDEIKELIESYRARGEMTRPEFCAGRAMSLSRFDYYVRRHRQMSKPVTRLAKVMVKPARAEHHGVFALVLANGRRVECGEAELSGLIRIAEAL